MNILLIGPRGAGKTTVGQEVASRSDRTFIDLDTIVLHRFSEPSVREVWAHHGEGAWRTAEVQALQEVLRCDNQVVALGGGVPMIPAAKALIESAKRRGRARVIYLDSPAATLQARLERNPGDRPALRADLIAEIPGVLAERDPTYRQLADEICPTEDRSAPVIAKDILSRLSPQR